MLDSLLASVEEYRVMYLDFDSFFASAEQQRRPDLRGRPLGVCPFVSEGGCIVAASREAKRLGVKTGMRVFEARRLARDIVLVRDTPAYYRAIHARTLKILEDTPCRVVVRGIDEMALVLPSYMRTRKAGEDLVDSLKQSFLTQLGEVVTASMGLAATSWQAKMAASARKPNGFVVLGRADYESFYAGLMLTDLTGIRYRMARRLYALGIHNPLELYRASEPLLRKGLGVNGTKWYLRLRGVEVDDRPPAMKQSIGHQTTLMPRAALSFSELEAVMGAMMLKVGYRLRATGRGARGMAVAVRFLDGGGWHGAARHLQLLVSHRDLVAAGGKILQQLQRQFRPVKKLSITTFDLVAIGQMSLLESVERDGDVSEALDYLRKKYGAHTVRLASSIRGEVFPDRIGFGAPESLFLPEG